MFSLGSCGKNVGEIPVGLSSVFTSRVLPQYELIFSLKYLGILKYFAKIFCGLNSACSSDSSLCFDPSPDGQQVYQFYRPRDILVIDQITSTV